MYNIVNKSTKKGFPIMKHGFIKVAAVTPRVTVADCNANLSEALKLFNYAHDMGVKLVVFPELTFTGSTAGDLFFSDTLLLSAQNALLEYAEKTSYSDTISIIGFPLIVNNKIYNSAAICQGGEILGIVPKQNLTYNEKRYFSDCPCGMEYVEIGERVCEFGTDLFFACNELSEFRFALEIGDDLFSLVPPSSHFAANGVTVIANPGAFYETVSAWDKQTSAVLAQSLRCRCGYILSSAGMGESTTDFVFGGRAVIAENGDTLAQKKAFASEQILVSEIDVKLLASEQRKLSAESDKKLRRIDFSLELCDTELTRFVDPHPFIPECKKELDERCRTILSIQAAGLAQRVQKAYAKKCVIGISGGLDSCLALLAAIRTMDILGRPHSDVVGVTMPCFGTTGRTKANAEILCAELGCELRCVNIADAVRQHFSDIGHDESNRNVVYENSQARERTQVLMDIANIENGLVVGTGDLSELALGWATYNGDHMSMYGVNGDIPKTLIRKIVCYCAEEAERNGQKELARVLIDIVDTPVSPELLPADESGNIAQKTEDLVGPYEIHDFYIYNFLRYGFSPDKLYRLAKIAFKGIYDEETLAKWLKNFVKRFFAQQFKRSCLPDGPKVGSVGLSPRGDWRMPSDASSAEWMKDIL